jgi:hypothetical protein
MSFFSNFSQDRCPCQITGNPLNGLCEKVCIQVKKVFDACLKQSQEQGVVLTLTDLVPQNPTYPLTFISAKSSQTIATITSLNVEPLADRPNLSRVQVSYSIPMEVIYQDANGVQGKGNSTMSFSQDIILFAPTPSIMPYEVEAVVSVVASEGTYTSENTFTITACTTSILKIVMMVELLIPSYGYCQIPTCQEYTQEICAGFFELPLFPQNNV